ncbi:MAG: ATPase, T2SS/T4P/T4SS family [Candidatus Aenigmarchaeota archaeon]|nr:ATPase, T2SS/T4P/T4SS family [Candidatus Aenigmarchaeota archaeon]
MLTGRVVFRKLVRGYRILKKRKTIAPRVEQIPISFPAQLPTKPLEVTGEVRLLPPEKPELEGIEIPPFKGRLVTKAGLEEEGVEEAFEATYPLIPEKPKKGEPIFAYAQIKWNPERNRYEYLVYQPTLSPETKRLFLKIKRLLEEKLDVDLTKLKETEAREYLTKQSSELMEYFRIKLTETEKQILGYYIDRDFLGLGVIEPLIRDPEIEDISCDGVGIPIYVFHRNPILGSMPTNIVFNSSEELDSYLVRLAQLCGQAISVIDPLLDGTLPDGSRIQATLGTDIARRGSNFSIRKFTKFPFTPTHLLKYGTVDIKTLAYLWLAVDYGCSVLVSGGTATGKTVFLNVLSLFIKPEMKIVSIEDTAELRLPHPHWVPHVARVPIATEEGKRKGEIDLFDLLKESMRQRPDYIILGEVRGKEAYVLFQQMASIPGYEKVMIFNDNHLRRVRISRLVSGKAYKTVTIDPETEKVKIPPIEFIVAHTPTKKLFKIVTKSGREVTTTGNHSVFTYTDRIEPILVEELKEGDKIVIPSKIPCGFNDVEWLNLMSLSDAKLKITPEFLRLLGYYISKGSIDTAKKNNSINLYNSNKKILDDMRDCIEKVTNKIPKERITTGFSSATELSFTHKTFFELFKRFCGHGSKNKKIPDFIFGLSREKIGQFLSALYAGDGSLNREKFSYQTTSKRLADDLLTLLLTLGIVGRVRKRKGLYCITFYRKDDQDKFLEFVRPIGIEVKTKEAGREYDHDEIFVDIVKSIKIINLKKPLPVYDLSVPHTQNFVGGFGGVMLHNTGHPSLATIHADSLGKLINRMITPPISLPPSLLETLDLIVFLTNVKYRGKYMRKVESVYEVTGYDFKKKQITTNLIFEWDPSVDKIITKNKSVVLKKIVKKTGLSEKKIIDELGRRMAVLNWLQEKNITDYRDVSRVINLYYSFPEKVLDIITGEI